MRILVDILHPAHVHFFRNFIKEMRDRGHEVMITARDKDCALDLLRLYKLDFELLSEQRAGTISLVREMVSRTSKLIGIARQWRPDVMAGIMGPSIAVAGKILRIPAIVFYDTEFATQTNWFVYPLAHRVCTPDCYQGRVRGNHVTYPGYHELAYLHPKRFAPDAERLLEFGLTVEQPYSLVRFVSWQAIHDVGEKGLTLEQKRKLVDLLGQHGVVRISAEGELPDELEPLRLQGPVHEIHHVLAHAQIIVGESATMASEAAVLGVPAVFIATTGRGYTDDQAARYGHLSYFVEDEFNEALAATARYLDGDPRDIGSRARERLLSDKIDVTGWMVESFEREFVRNSDS